MPVISLYTYIPVLLSVALLGESLNAMKIAGLLLVRIITCAHVHMHTMSSLGVYVSYASIFR